MLYKQLHNTSDFSKIDSLMENSKKNREHLAQIDNTAKDKGELLFRSFYIPVCDGSVPYQIIKITKTTATVKRCTGIDLDDYQDGLLGDQANIPLKMAERKINEKDAVDKIFD